MNVVSLSDVMLNGRPQYFTTLLKNNIATSFATHGTFVGMKMAYLEKQSISTMIPLYPYATKSSVMNSIETLTQGLSNTSKGEPWFFIVLGG
jgi:hypothetical protein